MSEVIHPVKKRRAPRKPLDAVKLGIAAARYLDRVVRGIEPADRQRIAAAIALCRPVLREAARTVKGEIEDQREANSQWDGILNDLISSDTLRRYT